MTVTRSKDQAGPATMTVFFASDTSSAAAINASSGVNERAEVIEMKHKPETEILNDIMQLTRAVKVEPTEEEVMEMQAIKEENEKAQRDRIRMQGLREEQLKERRLLEQAKQSVDAGIVA